MDSLMEDSDQTISTQMMETFKELAPLLDKSLQLAPNPRRAKAPRKGGANAPDEAENLHQQEKPTGKAMQLLTTMAQLIVRHDQELNSLRRTDQFILF